MGSDDRNTKNECGGNQAKPTRDARGRWTKGHCPNPKGRPRKKPKRHIDDTDLRLFGEMPIEVKTSDGVKVMTRRGALYQKMYEDAMRGKVSMQRFLYAEFIRSDEDIVDLHLQYQQLMTKWVIENKNFKGLDHESIPMEDRLQISRLQVVLHHHFPGSFPRPPFLRDNDDSD